MELRQGRSRIIIFFLIVLRANRQFSNLIGMCKTVSASSSSFLSASFHYTSAYISSLISPHCRSCLITYICDSNLLLFSSESYHKVDRINSVRLCLINNFVKNQLRVHSRIC